MGGTPSFSPHAAPSNERNTVGEEYIGWEGQPSFSPHVPSLNEKKHCMGGAHGMGGTVKILSETCRTSKT